MNTRPKYKVGDFLIEEEDKSIVTILMIEDITLPVSDKKVTYVGLVVVQETHTSEPCYSCFAKRMSDLEGAYKLYTPSEQELALFLLKLEAQNA